MDVYLDPHSRGNNQAGFETVFFPCPDGFILLVVVVPLLLLLLLLLLRL